MSSPFNEKILLYRLLSNKDPDAYALLYDQYVKQIYRFVYFKVRSREEAEDVTSEVFLKTWQYLQENREVSSFSGLLYRVARNCIIDLYRRKASRPEAEALSAETEVADTTNWFSNVEHRLDAAQVVGALEKLKQEYQEVITLRYVDGLEINEISAIMNKGQIAVRVMIHRALKRLKQILEEEK